MSLPRLFMSSFCSHFSYRTLGRFPANGTDNCILFGGRHRRIAGSRYFCGDDSGPSPLRRAPTRDYYFLMPASEPQPERRTWNDERMPWPDDYFGVQPYRVFEKRTGIETLRVTEVPRKESQQ